MATLEQSFDIAGEINETEQDAIRRVVGALEGVNRVKIDPEAKKVLVSYTPGIINIQTIKEAIESQGPDVSDRGDD